MQREANGHYLPKHGYHGTPTYKTWTDMIRRCTNPKATFYHAYGARGITVCERWRDFRNFLLDMGERPAGLTIDRIDNDRGYEPGNCRWVTAIEQQRNKGNNHRLTMNGETLTLAGWSERLHLSESVLRGRLALGWSVERVLTTPRHGSRLVARCKHGHEFTPENTYHWRRKDGREHRHCRACGLERYHKRRAAAAQEGPA